MDMPNHSLGHLFAQLGLAGDQAAIDRFVEMHSPMPRELLLAEAPFWTPAQACFLREEILEDGDWAEVVDELNRRLHS